MVPLDRLRTSSIWHFGKRRWWGASDWSLISTYHTVLVVHWHDFLHAMGRWWLYSGVRRALRAGESCCGVHTECIPFLCEMRRHGNEVGGNHTRDDSIHVNAVTFSFTKVLQCLASNVIVEYYYLIGYLRSYTTRIQWCKNRRQANTTCRLHKILWKSSMQRNSLRCMG